MRHEIDLIGGAKLIVEIEENKNNIYYLLAKVRYADGSSGDELADWLSPSGMPKFSRFPGGGMSSYGDDR